MKKKFKILTSSFTILTLFGHSKSYRPAEISKSVHRNSLIFCTKLGLPDAMEMKFSDFVRKIPFGLFQAILVTKIGQFLKI